MFTGLVQAVGVVESVQRTGRGSDGPVRLRINPGSWGHHPAHGDSISVSGCCLTVANRPSPRAKVLEFVAVPETLSKTKLGTLRAGSRVNLEHSLTANTLVGGHFVQGHVDGVGTIAGVKADDDWRMRVRLPKALQPYIVPKGSICLDGVSLTVAEVHRDGLSVALIPTTLELTTLRDLRPGDPVNVEADMIVKTVVSWAEHAGFVARKPAVRRRAAKRATARR